MSDTYFCWQHNGVTEVDGWYLEQVKVTKKIHKTGKIESWVFVCQNWLSLHVGDCLIRRLLLTEQARKTGKSLNFIIICLAAMKCFQLKLYYKLWITLS